MTDLKSLSDAELFNIYSKTKNVNVRNELIERYLGIRLTDKEKEDVAAASAVPQPMDGSAPSQNGNIPINPVSDSQNVQMPQGARVGALAPNLAGTTVGSANQDKRSMQFGGR